MGDIVGDPEIQEEFVAILETIKSENIKTEEPEAEFIESNDTEGEIIPDLDPLCKTLPALKQQKQRLSTKKIKDVKNQGEIENLNVTRSTAPKTYRGPKSRETPKLLEPAEDNSLASLCRLCATRSNDMVPMFGKDKTYKNIIKKIEHCLSVVVKRTDTLPQQACKKCLEKLEFCHRFHETVAEAEKQLTMLDDKRTGKLTEIVEQQLTPAKGQCQPITLTANSKGTEVSKSSKKNRLKRKRISQERMITPAQKIAKTKTAEPKIVEASAEDNNFLSNLKLDWDELIPITTDVNIIDQNAAGLGRKDQSTEDVLNSGRKSPPQIKLGSCFSLLKSPVHLKEMLKSSEKMCDLTVCPNSIIRTYKARHRAKSEDNECGDVTICNEKVKPLNFDIKCRFCGAALQTAKNCYIHESAHISTSYYPCSMCDLSFTTEKEWAEHRSEHKEGEETWKRRTVIISNCNESERKFLAELRTKFDTFYQNTESEEQQRFNEKMEKVGNPQTSLHRHMTTAHREHKDSCCKTRGIYYRTSEPLQAHQRDHERRFQCDLSNRRFCTDDRMENHMKKRRGLQTDKRKDRRYTCALCGEGFVWKSSMIMHVRKHIGYRPHKCSICEKSFTRPDGLKRHAIVHSEDRRYDCSVCTQSFRTNSARKSHMTIHQTERPHPCQSYGEHFWLTNDTGSQKETEHR